MEENLKNLILKAGIAAVEISESGTPKMREQEQALYIAGFCDCVKWLSEQGELKTINEKGES